MTVLHEFTLVASEDGTGTAAVCSCGEFRSPQLEDAFWYSATADESKRLAGEKAREHGAVPVGQGNRAARTRYLVCSGDGALSTTPDREVAARRAKNTLGWAAALAVVEDYTEDPNV